MRLASLHSRELRIPFKVAFKHASAERSSTQTLWVEAETDEALTGLGEGCPREYVSGENLMTAQRFFESGQAEWLAKDWTVEGIKEYVRRSSAAIDKNPAAWCAVEMALLDALGKSERRSVESLLSLAEPAGLRSYTAVLGVCSREQFEAQLEYYVRAGFRTFKVKMSGDPEKDHASVQAILGKGVPAERVRVDANNLWTEPEAAIEGLRALRCGVFAVEEPLRPGDLSGMREIGRALGCPIILDESARQVQDLWNLGQEPDRWIVNVRVSKMGGLIRTLAFLDQARRAGVKIIVGAHVGESSVLTRAGVLVAAATGEALVAHEGAFGTHLLARDAVTPVLMFGADGVLDVASFGLAGKPGLGLTAVGGG